VTDLTQTGFLRPLREPRSPVMHEAQTVPEELRQDFKGTETVGLLIQAAVGEPCALA
jgi:hypothetical protein